MALGNGNAERQRKPSPAQASPYPKIGRSVLLYSLLFLQTIVLFCCHLPSEWSCVDVDDVVAKILKKKKKSESESEQGKELTAFGNKINKKKKEKKK